MVAGSYVLSGPTSWFDANRAEAESSAELLREYAAKDTDRDSLPDWQESLYGTDPEDPESFQAGIKDGDAVAQGLIQPKVTVAASPDPIDPNSIPGTIAAPSSLTDRFAQAFLTQYLSSRDSDTPPTSAEIVAFVEAGIADLSATAAPSDTFTAADVRGSSTGGAAVLTVYAGQVETAFAANTTPANKNELEYFADALRGDTSALPKIADISEAYADIATALIRISVPTEARQAHLAIANALMHMSEVSEDMAAMDEDPLRALMGIGLYEDEAAELIAAFKNLDGVFKAQQVSIPEGQSGYFIVKTAGDAAAASQ